MDGFWSSISKWFSEKTSSPLYFTYLAFVIIWNWKFFQVVFLESSTLFEGPRVEYIDANLSFGVELFGRLSPFINSLFNLAWHFIPPAALTYGAIIWLPHVQRWALKTYLSHRFERMRMFALEQRKHDIWLLNQEQERSQTLRELVSAKEEQARSEEKIEKSDEMRWYAEYQEFEKSGSAYRFKQILESVYKHDGWVFDGNRRNAEPGAVALADTWGLITYLESRNVIELTEKGKFFARKYLDKHPIV